MFGTSQVGVIQNESFRCVVSTVLERVRQSYSTLVSSPLTASGARTRTNKWFAKATLHRGMSRGQRADTHRALQAHLDALGCNGIGLVDASVWY